MAAEDVYALYPWMKELGFTDIVDELLADDVEDPRAILSAIRRSPRHAQIFPGMIGPDGQMRVENEFTYRQRMDEYRSVLRDHGINTDAYTDFELGRFLDPDIDLDPNELSDRLTIYSDLKRSGRHIRDAFYVYANISMSDDDLYTYVVDPNKRAEFDQRYTQAVATNPPDYATFITRATEAGLDRVAQSLRDLEEQGIAITGAAATIANIDPDFARMLADAIYMGTPADTTAEDGRVVPESGQTPLGLEELTHSLELAFIGGAAATHGLQIPDIARITEIRQAGIDRAQAMQAYGTFATQKSILEGQVARLNQGRTQFTQADFEEAVFLADAEESSLLARAAAREAAFGQSQGNVQFSTTRTGRMVQAGFRRPFT